MAQSEVSSQFNVDLKHSQGAQVGDNNSQTNNYYSSNDPEEEPLREFKKEEKLPPSPYKGLERFEAEDSDRFYGRKKLIQSLTNYLEENNIIFILGASGSGKSSLVQAGIIPEISGKIKYLFKLCFVPSKDPFKSFSSKIDDFFARNREKYEESEERIDQLVEQLTQSPQEGNTILKIIEEIKKEKDDCGLIFIDQFEEVFTLTKEEKRNNFIENLISLINIRNQKIQIILAMRNDFYPQLGAYSEFLSVTQSHIRNVLDMTDRELRLVIKNPAAKHGVKVEEDLIAQIIKDFWGQSRTSLPLLQYTLDLLWRTEFSTKELLDGELNQKTYKDLGGIGGALQKEAENIYQKFEEKGKGKAVEQIFIKLITVTSDGKAVSNRESRATFNELDIKDTVDKLINHRLLVSGRSEDTIEIAHEALIESWERLQEWIEKHKEVLILKRQLIESAITWYNVKNDDKKNKAISELWTGYKLERLLELKEKNAIRQLDQVAEAFIQASIEYRDRSEQEKLERILDASISSSQLLFASNNRLDALVNLIKIGNTLQKELEKYEYSRLRFLIIFGKLFNELAEYNSIHAHEGIVSSISFSREEDEIFASVGYQDRIIKFWRRDGTQMKIIDSKHLLPIRDLTFSSDGEMLASASEDGSVKLWQTRILKESEDSNQFIFVEQYGMPIGHEDDVSSISFNDKRKIIASASSDGTVKLWSYEDNTFQSLLKHKDQVFCVSCSPNGEMIASGDCSGNVRLWNGDGELLKEFQAHSNSVSTVSFSPDNETLISCSSDKYIKLWYLHKESIEEPIIEFSEDEEVYCATFSPDGKKIASTNKDGTIVIRFTDGKLLKTLKGHRGFVSKVTFSPDGKFLISSGEDGTIKFWHCQSRFEGHDDEIWGIDFSANGETLITASSDKTARLWKRNGECLRILAHESKVYDAKLSPDGSTVVTVTVDGVIRIWNDIQANDHKLLCKPISISDAIANSISFSPTDDIFLMAGKDGTIKVFDLKGKLLAQKPTDEENLIIVTFSHNGKIIASTSNDKKVKMWKFDNEKLSQIFKPITDFEENVYHVSFSNDDQKIATVNQSGDFFEIKLWDLDGKIIKTIKGNHKDSIRDLRFNQDDKMIALVTSHCLEFWNLNGILLKSIQLNDINNDINNIFRASISHDWSAIALSYPKNDYENKVEFWNLNLKETVEDVRHYLDEYLKLG
ncbi:nSTAND1 domain-containing NTPase [Nostoc sp.]|uniref:nSTAND1 domain-containing NTPase n=1 Tax=Nostoc sp. TaxID=1180 RepID=UPI002FF8EE95